MSAPVHQAAGTRDIPGSRIHVGRGAEVTQTCLGKRYRSEAGLGPKYEAGELELSLADNGELWNVLG